MQLEIVYPVTICLMVTIEMFYCIYRPEPLPPDMFLPEVMMQLKLIEMTPIINE